MRVNKYVAAATGLSRRAADQAIEEGRVTVNGKKAQPGQEVNQTDEVRLDHKKLAGPSAVQTIMFNKPVGYVVSRDGQGSKTIYDLLPPDFHHLKPVGRLDKDSSGLLLLTNNGQLAQELTHPKYRKMKIYEVELDKPLTSADWQKITEVGVRLEDGVSRFELHWLEKNDGLKWVVTIYEGRNRQIRRSFAALGYTVKRLHRTHFGDYFLGDLQPSYFKILEQ
jgi:23S rRNA pseudouridine2605 synthase